MISYIIGLVFKIGLTTPFIILVIKIFSTDGKYNNHTGNGFILFIAIFLLYDLWRMVTLLWRDGGQHFPVWFEDRKKILPPKYN